MAGTRVAELTDAQHAWASSFCGVDTRAEGPRSKVSASGNGSLAEGLESATSLTPVDLTPPSDPQLLELYNQLGIDAAPGGLSVVDACWSPRLALYGAWTAVIAAGAGTVIFVLAPEPTTLTKWAALGTAAALVGSLASLIAAYGAVADCVQAQADAEERKREIEDLRRHQRQIEGTLEKLKREIERR